MLTCIDAGPGRDWMRRISDAALGTLAIGRYAYAGPDVAIGSQEASGRQKETLFG
jgi:hypothetical protein